MLDANGGEKMANSAENFVAERVNRSDKKVVALRAEVGKARRANAKPEPMYEEDPIRMRKFYEYCEQMISAQYAMWKENGKLKY